MISKIKALGLAFVVIAAMSVLAASAAQAGTIDVGQSPAVITGHSEVGQEHVSTLTRTKGESFKAKCNTVSFEGTTQGQATQEWEVTPTYGVSETAPTGCTIFGLSGQARMNGCKYRFTGAGQPANTFLVDITGCTAGKQIETQMVLCTILIPEQTGLSHMVSTNLPGGKEVTLEATVKGVKVTQVGSGCPDGNNHVSTSFSFSGNTIVKAFEDAGTQLVTKHGHQYNQLKEGAQISILST